MESADIISPPTSFAKAIDKEVLPTAVGPVKTIKSFIYKIPQSSGILAYKLPYGRFITHMAVYKNNKLLTIKLYSTIRNLLGRGP